MVLIRNDSSFFHDLNNASQKIVRYKVPNCSCRIIQEDYSVDELNDVTKGVKAVERALVVLSCFTMEVPELSLAEICSRAGLPKATVHRLLATLAQTNFVIQDPTTSLYRLGYKLMVMGAIAQSQINYVNKAEPIFRELVHDIEETINVASLDGDHHVCTLVVEPERPVKVTAKVGVLRPCYFGAAGLVLLAYQPEFLLDELLPSGKLEAFTVWSDTDPAEYHRRLSGVREHGFAIERGEAFPDVTALAAPIFDHQGKVVAAAAIVAPTHRVPDDRIAVLLKKLLAATNEISQELGAPQNMVTANSPSGEPELTSVL
jgi:IclR family transcriptional regulator, KDG regulon repressor